MGGEKSRVAPRSDPGTGSPPRGRGKVSSVSMCTRSPGITPAWAGKRSCCASRSRSLKDHPRVGGEKLTSLPKIQPALGSPPRGRGKGPTGQRPLLETRITPAWAGKRQHRAPKRVKRKDHPRVGGEKCPLVSWLYLVGGSPPRGRGKVYPSLLRKSFPGITPAWAGKRCYAGLIFTVSRDHPRVGGEKRCCCTGTVYRWGSPPRGRGKEQQTYVAESVQGITPAWAGKRIICQEPPQAV